MSTVHVFKKDGGCEVIQNVTAVDYREGVLRVYGETADQYYNSHVWDEVSEVH